MTDSSDLPTWMVEDEEVRARLGLDEPAAGAGLPGWMTDSRRDRVRVAAESLAWHGRGSDWMDTQEPFRRWLDTQARANWRHALGLAGEAVGRAGRRLAGQFPTPPVPYTIPKSRWSRFSSFVRGHTHCVWDWGTWKVGAAFSRHSASISLLCLQIWVTTYRTVNADDW